MPDANELKAGRCTLWNSMRVCGGHAMSSGLSERAAARLFGIDRKTLSKILEHSVPPGYRRSKPPVRPKLDPFIPIIDQILEEDREVLRKQRHTAQRIFGRLRAEGSREPTRPCARPWRENKRREVFVPLSHPPAEAQFDFGEAVGVIGGVRRELHCFAMVDIGSAIGPSDNADAALGCVLHQGVSGRDDRGVSRDSAAIPRRSARGCCGISTR